MAEERGSFLEPVFAFEPINETFDPTAVPANGSEYLQYVHYEAKMCDQVVTAEIDVKKIKTKGTPIFYGHPGTDIVHRKEFLPPSDLQSEWLAEFSNARSTVERRRVVQVDHHLRKFLVPTLENEQGWYKFCVGDYHASEETDEMSLDGESVSEKLDKECSLENSQNLKVNFKDIYTVEYCEPRLQIMTALTQVQIIAILDYHVDWLQEKKTDFKHSGRWVYALLACLEIPLTPETCSSIRSLARLAADCRSKLMSPDDSLLAPLNLIICLVAKYFRQLDLADG